MELLDSRQLRAFQELARQGSFTGAARALNLTQSAISHSIKALEGSLGTELFERLGKSVRLTRAGEALLPHADRILSRMERAQEDLALLTRPGHGRLRIGLLSSWVAEEEIARGRLVFRDSPWEGFTRRWSVHRDPRREPGMIGEVFTGIARNVVETLLLRTGEA